MSELIRVENLNFEYEKNSPILRDVSLAVEQGESIGLIGANGAGKSTLLRLLVGLDLTFDGKIIIDNSLDMNKKNLAQIRKKIGYVFQDSDSQLFTQSVFEDVAFGPRSYGLSAAEVDERVEKALSMVNISHLKNRPIYKMSGGEKKLASIATILSMEPEIILLDEPTIALDPKNRRNLIKIINELPQAKIIATHDLDLVRLTCSKVMLMNSGKICVLGTPSEILSNEMLLEENNL